MRAYVILGLMLGLSAVTQAGEFTLKAGGKTQGFDRFWEDYERCKAREEFTPKRGEYETQDEYRRRIESLRVGCDTHRRLENAQLDITLRLSYDANAERFSFELPVLRGLRLQYDALVWDDFPLVLNKLPRDVWHIDDPTPKASAYKECTLRTVTANEQYISRIEPFRADSWRGCMTYYKQGEDVGWRREQDAFFITDITFFAYSDILPARKLKQAEKNLIYRIQGVLWVPEQTFEVQQVTILNMNTGEALVTLAP